MKPRTPRQQEIYSYMLDYLSKKSLSGENMQESWRKGFQVYEFIPEN